MATCNYVYDKDASSSTRIVTICHHCGKIEVKDLMEMWTEPPAKWLPLMPRESKTIPSPMIRPSLPGNILLN